MQSSILLIFSFVSIIYLSSCNFKFASGMKRKSSALENLEEPAYKKQKISTPYNSEEEIDGFQIEDDLNIDNIYKYEIRDLREKFSKCPSYYRKNKLLISGFVRKMENNFSKIFSNDLKKIIERFHFGIDILLELISTTYGSAQLETPLNFIKQLQNFDIIENCYMNNELIESYWGRGGDEIYENEIGRINYPEVEIFNYENDSSWFEDISVPPLEHVLEVSSLIHFKLSKIVHSEFKNKIFSFLNTKGINDNNFAKLNQKQKIMLFIKLQIFLNLSLIMLKLNLYSRNLFLDPILGDVTMTNIYFINSVSKDTITIWTENHSHNSMICFKDIGEVSMSFI